eukprot:3930807-Alexandrium_andersonii.AAC.1
MFRLRRETEDTTSAIEAATRAIVESLLGQPLDEEAWTQATLPLCLGGLGLPAFGSLAAAAFLG